MISRLQFDEFPIIGAPMAGITDQPFREILRKCNPKMPLETEMISCHSITAKTAGRNSDKYFGKNTGAQIFGADPKLMAEAAKILEQNGATWIDINMGCPVPKVATRAGAGAFLMRDHKLAGKIMDSVVSAVKIPVSVKTRLGWDEKNLNSDDLLRIAAESGIAFATVHARTRAQGYSGNADWEKIPIPQKIPVIFNGDIKNQNDIETVKKIGASGAMIGRAMLGNPGIFSKVNLYEIVPEHFDLTVSYYGNQGIVMFRKHLAWYAAGLQGANQFRQKINSITETEPMADAIAEFFKKP